MSKEQTVQEALEQEPLVAERSSLETAVEAAREAAERVQHWRAEVDDARAQVQDLEVGVGAAVVEDPDAAVGLAEQIASARARLTIAEAAIPEAERRHKVAVTAALLAEADSMEPERVGAQEALVVHSQRTEKLLDQLRKHTGRDWRMVTIDMLADEDRDRGGSGRVSMPAAADWKLRQAVTAVQRRQQLLRGVAEGLSVHEALSEPTWADLGECLRPGGVADLGWVEPEEERRRRHEAERERLAAAEEEHAAAEAALAWLIAPQQPDETQVEAYGRQTRAASERFAFERRLAKARSGLFTVRAQLGLDIHTGEPTGESA